MNRSFHTADLLEIGKSWGHRFVTNAQRYIAERRFSRIQRCERNRCWCGGELQTFRWHQHFGTCLNCGSYVNCNPPLLSEFKKLYSLDLYWHTRQKWKGFPRLELRPDYDRADGRLDRWLKVIHDHHKTKGRVIEIGCGHGVLLSALQEEGHQCLGVELDEKVVEWTCKTMGLDMRLGCFPEIELPSCDLFMAFDVIEHSPYPDHFLRAAANLITAEGRVIIQTPLDHDHGNPPFPENFSNVFDDLEHHFVFTIESFRHLAVDSGLEVVGQATGIRKNDIVVLRRRG